ncbi:GDPD1 (predicted) [Pycnogonum litorale]
MAIFGVGWAVLGGYVLTSCFLFKYPKYLHGKKNRKFKARCVHISHRGGAGENLENTMMAFKHAICQGTDMLEIDVQQTKDKKVVICHDNNLERVTGQNVCISDLLYEKLPLLNSTLNVDFGCGKTCTNYEDRKIPLLEEVFERFPSMPMNVDLKNDNLELIQQVSDLIEKYERQSITVWGNFQESIIRKCCQVNPNIPIMFSLRRVIILLLLTYTGLLPFVPIKESCLEVFLPKIYPKKKTELFKTQNILKSFVFFVADKMLMKKFIFDHLDKRGIQVFLWVLNDETDFNEAFKLGAHGVMTDYPIALKEFLDRKPELIRS